MKNRHSIKRILAAGVATQVIAGAAFAQTQNEQVSVIVVTAERRAESIQDIPVAASATDAESIRERGLADPIGLSRIAPSVDIWSSFGESQPKITIRGIGSSNFEQATDSTAVIYIDESPLTPSPAKLPQFFDLERVEVLRGPQGTLYGRNSTAGAINLITRRPSGETGGYVAATGGNHGQFDLEGAFETPLSDQLAVRVAAKRQFRDGYGVNTLTGEDIFDRDSLAGRIGVSFEGERFDAYVKAWGHKSRALGFFTRTIPTEFDDGDPLTPSLEVPAHLVTGAVPDPDPYRGRFNDQHSDIDNYGFNGNFGYDLGNHSVDVVLGYVSSEQDMDHDCDGSEFLVCQVDFIADAEEYVAEARLTSNLDGPFNYIVGINYLDETIDLDNRYQSILLPGAIGSEFVSQLIAVDTESFAVFADGTFQITDALELFGGVRWTKDEKAYDFQAFFADNTNGAPLIPFADDEEWDEFTYRAGLNWAATDDLNAYFSFSHGYRSGSYPSGFLPSNFGPVDPEFVNNYEVGMKGIFFDRRLLLNAALFYMKFRNQQLLATPPGTSTLSPELTNAGESEIFGFEAEGEALLSDFLSVGYSFSFLETEYLEFRRGTRDLAGLPLANAPKYDLVVSPEFTQPLGDGEAFLNADFSFIAKQRAGNDFDLLERDVQDAYQVIDARLGWRSDRLDIFLWAKNITDELILRDWLDLSPFGFNQYIYDEPRSYGITVNVNY